MKEEADSYVTITTYDGCFTYVFNERSGIAKRSIKQEEGTIWETYYQSSFNLDSPYYQESQYSLWVYEEYKQDRADFRG